MKNNKMSPFKSVHLYIALMMLVSAGLMWFTPKESSLLKISAFLMLLAAMIQLMIVHKQRNKMSKI
ncbi:hypothetical protein [Tetragenococcus solitarius]|uniref:Uncharacterized protein n=1 Tax=Tetragenococcus solitarius TaxID=71453 RepID=A0ABN3Y1F7_9ENTE|nr:hypothetical protein [Tetragenococcus solitarius]